MDMSLVIMLAAFGGTAAAVWVLIEMFVAAKSRAEERLDELRDPSLRKDRTDESEVTAKKKGTKEAFGRLVEKAQALAKPLQPKGEEEEGKLKVKLAELKDKMNKEKEAAINLEVKKALEEAAKTG